MPKDKEYIFGDIVVKNTTLKRANEIRSGILSNFERKWVYVIKTGKEVKYQVGVANHFSFRLTPIELNEIKTYIKENF